PERAKRPARELDEIAPGVDENEPEALDAFGVDVEVVSIDEKPREELRPRRAKPWKAEVELLGRELRARLLAVATEEKPAVVHRPNIGFGEAVANPFRLRKAEGGSTFGRQVVVDGVSDAGQRLGRKQWRVLLPETSERALCGFLALPFVLEEARPDGL